MPRTIRLMTVGFKSSVSEALARCEELDVTALSYEPACDYTEDLSILPYEMKSKLSQSAIRNVRNAVRQVRPDIIHAYGSRSLAHTVLGTVGMRDRPRIVSYRGVANSPSPFRLEDWLSYLSPKIDLHACESQASLDALVAGGISAEKCFVAYNCLTRFPNTPLPRTGLAEFGIPENAFVVATVANMRPVKGADLLLEAAMKLQDLKDCYWLLLGEVRDPRINELANDPRIRNRVSLAGFRKDAMEIAAAADLFVMPSRSEALCVALLEAMTLGLCPIVSSAGGMKEVVRDGVDGLVFPNENVTALTNSVRKLYSDRELIKRFSNSAKQRASTEFSGDAMAKRLVAGYRSILPASFGELARPAA